jgi:hypothetical protein
MKSKALHIFVFMEILKFLIGSSLDIKYGTTCNNLQKLLNHITLSILILSNNILNGQLERLLHNLTITKRPALLNRLINKPPGHLIALKGTLRFEPALLIGKQPNLIILISI